MPASDREVTELGIGEFLTAVAGVVSLSGMQRMAIWCIESAEPMSALKVLDPLCDRFEIGEPLKQVDWCRSFCTQGEAQELVLHCLHCVFGVLVEIMQCSIFNARSAL